jgi:hypothetical protein
MREGTQNKCREYSGREIERGDYLLTGKV